ncbi:MAG: hypothetical protein M1597_00695 [Candidatus Thermoplasmatota archaeon]|nr:hypothetical protein [Candidatus Thermoplasmatota archaeon]
MIALVKAIIIAVVVVGVAAPTTYVAYNYLAASSTQMERFIPQGVSAVVDYKVNGTNLILYASNNTAGVLINYNLTSFEKTAKNYGNGTSNSTVRGSNLSVKYYMTYESYSIYKVSNLSFPSPFLPGSFNGSVNNATGSVYITPIGNSFVVLSNLTGVEMSINANHTGNYLKVHQQFLSIKGEGISFYVNVSALDYSKTLHLANSSGVNVYSNMFKGVTIYGNVSAQFTNLTITNVSPSLARNLSLVNGILPTNLTVSSSYANGVYNAEYKVGFRNYQYVMSEILGRFGNSAP